MLGPFADAATPRLLDAFAARHPGAAHPPSMCLFDQADGPPRCLDFAFVTADLAPRIASVVYDQSSRASDHQPLIVELREE
jgi:endonuclease/exonuclease/phosphatase family metal-dependent hydrolase